MSKKYSLNQEDFAKILKTILYSAGSAVVATLIVVVSELDFGAYSFLIPAVNAILYGAERFLKGTV